MGLLCLLMKQSITEAYCVEEQIESKKVFA